MYSKVEVVACKTEKVNTIFIATVFVHVSKHISGQHLCKQGNACTTKRELWGAELEKQILYLWLLCLFMFPNMFLSITSINKQVHAQQRRSCGVQD